MNKHHLFKALLIGIFLSCTFSSSASNFLLLHHGRKSITYIKGSEINVRIDQQWLNGYLDSIGKDFIIVSRIKIPFSVITAVKTYRTGLNYGGTGVLLMIGGPFLMGIEALNENLRGETTRISNSTHITAGSAFTLGFILFCLRSKTYNLNKSNTLEAIIL